MAVHIIKEAAWCNIVLCLTQQCIRSAKSFLFKCRQANMKTFSFYFLFFFSTSNDIYIFGQILHGQHESTTTTKFKKLILYPTDILVSKQVSTYKCRSSFCSLPKIKYLTHLSNIDVIRHVTGHLGGLHGRHDTRRSRPVQTVVGDKAGHTKDIRFLHQANVIEFGAPHVVCRLRVI